MDAEQIGQDVQSKTTILEKENVRGLILIPRGLLKEFPIIG